MLCERYEVAGKGHQWKYTHLMLQPSVANHKDITNLNIMSMSSQLTNNKQMQALSTKVAIPRQIPSGIQAQIKNL